jgi:peptidoglycan/LPS O-acetylase OafA/YrhL
MFLVHSGDVSQLFMKTTQLPGTLDEFGAGIFLAKWVLDGRVKIPAPRVAWPIAAVSTGWIAMTIFWARADYWIFPAMVLFWHSAFAVFLLCLLAASITLPQVIAFKWLRPLDHLGEVSYGIYLWHLFAIECVILAWGYRGIESLVYVMGLTLIASGLSWRYLEKPIMALARRRPARA